MRAVPSFSVAILTTVAGAVPRSEAGDLGAEDGSLDLFNSEASEALVYTLPADISADSDETIIFEDLDLAFDNTAISNSIDLSCISPASKRDVSDEISILAEFPAWCQSDLITAPLDLTVPSLDPGSFELLLEGSQEKTPLQDSAEEDRRKQRPWWSPKRIPFFLQHDNDRLCDQEQGDHGLIPVCCWTWPNRAGRALRCIYYDPFKCLMIRYQLCCEFLDFIANPYNDEYRDAYGCPWDGGFATDETDMN